MHLGAGYLGDAKQGACIFGRGCVFEKLSGQALGRLQVPGSSRCFYDSSAILNAQHLPAHQQEVATGIGMQFADIPLRRMGYTAVPRAVAALQAGEEGIVVAFLQVAWGKRDVTAIAAIERVERG